jgi:TetR/AcrR family transcriptional regulator, regulator of cefoperazone and chloramphenicol sensitivity
VRARNTRAVDDIETQARLLNAAARLFAARGFRDVTVREICAAARANVAAVNYHFGDKLGLYREVVGKAIATMQATTEAARRSGEGRSPEDKLRAYVRVFLQRVCASRQDSWIHQIMAHEMADPTPALDLVFEEVIRPRLAYVGQIVSEIIKRRVDDRTVLRCVLSIQAQCHAAMKNPIAARLLPDLFDSNGVEPLAMHIAEFSLAGVRGVAGRPTALVRRR